MYQQPISRLVEFIVAAYHDNPDINLEVFVHKAEKMQEEDKIGTYFTSDTNQLQPTFRRELSPDTRTHLRQTLRLITRL